MELALRDQIVVNAVISIFTSSQCCLHSMSPAINRQATIMQGSLSIRIPITIIVVAYLPMLRVAAVLTAECVVRPTGIQLPPL